MSWLLDEALWPRPGDDPVVAADRRADRVLARARRVFPRGVAVGYAGQMPTTDSSPWAWHWLDARGRGVCGMDVRESTVRWAGAQDASQEPSMTTGGLMGCVDCDFCALAMITQGDAQVRAAAAGVVSCDPGSPVAVSLLQMLTGLAQDADADALAATALLDAEPVPGVGSGVRAAVAGLARHGDARVRAVVAWSPWADADVLKVLAQDADAVVRRAVSRRVLVASG